MIRSFEGGIEAFTRFTEFLQERVVAQEAAIEAISHASADVLYDHAYKTYGDATKLQDLAPSTQAERERLGYSANEPLLRDGTLLRDALEKRAEGNLAGIGSAEMVALYHEYGYHNARTGTDVPARPVFRTAMIESAPEIRTMLQRLVGASLGFNVLTNDLKE